MNKAYLIFTLLCLSVFSTCFSQNIQDTFFGCKYNSNKIKVIDALESENTYILDKTSIVSKTKTIETFDIKFGGYNFRFSTWSFYFDKLYSVQFSSNHKRKEEAYEMYSSIKETLINKYYYAMEDNKDGSLSIYWNDDKNSVLLEMERSVSKGGDLYYYVRLSYWNKQLLKLSVENDKNEL